MNKVLLILVAVLSATGISFWVAGGHLSSPAFARIGPPPGGLSVQEVVFNDVHGWYFPAAGHRACILLLHSVKSNRTEMVDRAIFLNEEGYSSFAIDLQAHGETPGQNITYGYKESHSVRSALSYLTKKQYCRKVVVIGNSLGGAASLLGEKPAEVDGYILEAVYPTIESAITNRLKIYFGEMAGLFSPLFYWQIPIRLGVDLKAMRPVNAIRNITSPVLIMNGTEDSRTSIREARLLYDNAPQPKEFVAVEGAAHTDLYRYNRNRYREVVLGFLSTYTEEE